MIGKILKVVWIVFGALIVLLNLIWRLEVMNRPAHGIGGIGVGIARGLIMALLTLALVAYGIITAIVLLIRWRRSKKRKL